MPQLYKLGNLVIHSMPDDTSVFECQTCRGLFKPGSGVVVWGMAISTCQCKECAGAWDWFEHWLGDSDEG